VVAAGQHDGGAGAGEPGQGVVEQGDGMLRVARADGKLVENL